MTNEDRDDDTFALSQQARFYLFYLERGLNHDEARQCADYMVRMGYEIPDDWRPA